ncbi:MAG: flagellar biosynthetic protein FliR [Spirochaetales bacterium]|nr:MAG: flagellar biosynthetic protein FliR [Spirochaetales bacterium]
MDWSVLLDNARLFLLVFARVAALLRVAPVTSSSAIPPLARGALAFFAAVVLFNFAGNVYGPLPETALGFAAVVIAEILLGIIMGLFLQIVFAVFQTAGQLFSFQMGFGASQVYDPLAQVEIPLIGQFLNLIGLAVFLSVSGMQKMFFSGLATSFRVLKGTDFLAASDYLNETFITAIGGLFGQSLILAFPILGTLMLVSVTMGLLAKAAPQMNLLMVGFPIQIGVGFIVLLISAPFLAEKMSSIIDMSFNWMQQYFLATKEALP